MQILLTNNRYNFPNNYAGNKNINFYNKSIKPLTNDVFELSNSHNSVKNINLEKIKALDIKNLRLLNSNIISGGTFAIKPDNELKLLKNTGIDTIIDFRIDAEKNFAGKCKKEGLKYILFPLDDVISRNNPNYFTKQTNKQTIIKPEFINKLKEYFKVMNNNNVYVGCHYGIDRTNIGLVLNYLLNSEYQGYPPEIKTWPGEQKKRVLNLNIKAVKKIFKSLTDEQKQNLGLELEYQKALAEKISKLIRQNHATL